MFPRPLPAALRQRQPERPILPWESLEDLGIKHWKTLEFRGMTCGSTATERQMYVYNLYKTCCGTKTNPSERLECRFCAVQGVETRYFNLSPAFAWCTGNIWQQLQLKVCVGPLKPRACDGHKTEVSKPIVVSWSTLLWNHSAAG